MSRPDSTRWQILDCLLENEPIGATREHLLQAGGLSTAAFYRAIKSLTEEGLVVEAQGRYRMPLSHFQNYRYKLWRDSEKLFRLSDSTAQHVLQLVQESRKELGENLLAVWLVGSAAHDQMHEASDLDFLAVVKEPTDWFPRSRFEVNFLTFEESEFREKAIRGDGFTWAAIRYGLLLEEGGWARDFLANVTFPTESFMRDNEEDTWEQVGTRFMFFVREKEPKEALRMLRAMAVGLGRRMLRTMGELPAGRPQLLEACRLYFGDNLGDLVESVFELEPNVDLLDMVRLSHQLRHYRERYEAVRLNWETWASYPYSGPVEFESMTFALVDELFPAGYTITRDSRWDIRAESENGQSLLIECKSLEREVTLEHVSRLKVENGALPILLANCYRSVPPLHRPDFFSSEVRKLVADRGILLMTSLEFFREHHQYGLEWESYTPWAERIIPAVSKTKASRSVPRKAGTGSARTKRA